MLNMSNIEWETIERNVMLILVKNSGQVFTMSELYTKVLDKILPNPNSYVDSEYKYKYILVVKQLPSMYTDITVKKINNKYFISYDNPKIEFIEQTNEISLPNDEDISSYIIKNNLNNYYYSTIYHDLIKGNNYKEVDKLLLENKIDVTINDEFSKVSIDYINDIKMTNVFIKHLYKKVDDLEKKVNDLEKKILEKEKKELKDKENACYNWLFFIVIVIMSLYLLL